MMAWYIMSRDIVDDLEHGGVSSTELEVRQAELHMLVWVLIYEELCYG